MHNNCISSAVFTWHDLDITLQELLHVLGISSADTAGLLDAGKFLYECESSYSSAQAGYVIFDDVQLIEPEGKLRVGEVQFSPGPLIVPRLRYSQKIALILCNAGVIWEKKARELAEQGSLMESYLFDSMGSLVADKLSQKIRNKLAGEVLRDGLRCTQVYSPGYCRWSLLEQHTLFSLLPAGFCDVRLTEHCLMIPVKSVSGIMGIGIDVNEAGQPCEICELETCFLRKK